MNLRSGKLEPVAKRRKTFAHAAMKVIKTAHNHTHTHTVSHPQKYTAARVGFLTLDGTAAV